MSGSRGNYQSRPKGINTDTMGSPFEGQSLGNQLNSAFCCTIPRVTAGKAANPTNRRQIDDGTAVLITHHFSNRFAGNHGPFNIDLKEFLPVFYRVFKCIMFNIHPHSVNKDVNSAIFFDNLIHQICHTAFISHIRRNSNSLIAGFICNFFGDRINRFLVPAGNNHSSAVNSKPQCQCLTNTTCPTGNNRNLSIKFKYIFHCSSPSCIRNYILL